MNTKDKIIRRNDNKSVQFNTHFIVANFCGNGTIIPLLLLQSHFVTQFSMEKLESLIGSIPEDLHSSIVIPWLQDDLVPFISRAFPSGLVS